MTTGEYFVSGLPLRLNSGHTLTVTAIPNVPGSQSQIFQRDFRIGNVLYRDCAYAVVLQHMVLVKFSSVNN